MIPPLTTAGQSPSSTLVQAPSPFAALGGPNHVNAADKSRAYVSLSPTFSKDVFAKQAGGGALRAYFSPQSFRAQFASFALAATEARNSHALNQRLAVASAKNNSQQRVKHSSLASMVYTFVPQKAGSQAKQPTFSGTHVALRVQATPQKNVAGQSSSRANKLADVTAYTTQAIPYQIVSESLTRNIQFGKRPLPNLLTDTVPTSANFAQLPDGSLQTIQQLGGVTRQQQGWQKIAAATAENLLTRFTGLRKYAQLDEDKLALTVGNHQLDVPLAAYQAGDKQVTPLTLMRFGKQIVQMARPRLFEQSESLLKPQTSTRLNDTRQKAEALANQLQNTPYFGARLNRQAEATQYSQPVKLATASPVSKGNPFKSVGFSGDSKMVTPESK